MTALRLALITTTAAVSAVGLATTAHADPENQLFQSPSGDIKCELTVSYKGDPYANCTVSGAAYAVPADNCESTARLNPQFGLTQGDTPTLSCVLDFGDYQWPTLDYGQTRSVGTINCDNEAQGVTCTDSGTGRFFRVSNESYDLG
jgi:hypothetical protein